MTSAAMRSESKTTTGGNPGRGSLKGPLRSIRTYIGLFPFFIYSGIFLAIPTLRVVILAFQNQDGAWTLENLKEAITGVYLLSFQQRMYLSAISAVTAAIFGFIAAYAITISNIGVLRRVIQTASGVFANTGGVPLAFFFIASIGTYGLLTTTLKKLGVDLYGGGWTLFTFSGLVLVYLYFQIPLMIIVILPAIDGLRLEWREAAGSLGASKWQFWRYVAIPLLAPAFTGALLLLFANSFAAYATASALTSGTIPLVPLQIGSLVSGNVIADKANLGYALGFGMVVIIGIVMTGYAVLQRKTAKWLSN